MGCSGSTEAQPVCTEIQLECSDGITLAAQSWRNQLPNGKQAIDSATTKNENNTEEIHVLCLHGWMDNAASFHYLAPALISRLEEDTTTDDNAHTRGSKSVVHLVALDLPGHGLSSHKSVEAPPMIRAEYIFYVAEALRLLKWWDQNDEQKKKQKKIILIGHSMGAGISLLYAASFPEQIRQLILLDNFGGSLARPAETTSEHLRTYVQTRQRDGPWILQPENIFYYPTWDSAFKARCRSPSYLPGKQYISEEAALELVKRGVVEKTDPKTNKKGFGFRHDPRLMWSSLQFFSMEQLEALYRDIQCPTCILLAENGWPVEAEALARVKTVLKPTVLETRMPGSHHFHADPESADKVVTEVVNFLCLDRSSTDNHD